MKQQSPARPRFTSPWRASEQKPVGIAVLLASVSVGLFLTLLPYDFERAWGLPLLYTLRGPLAPPREVAIVALDQDSAKRLGMPPSYALWPRQRHAELVRLLKSAGAKVVVFDVVFPDTTLHTPDENAEFAAALHDAGNVVLTSEVAEGNAFVEHTDTLVAPLKPVSKTLSPAIVIMICQPPAPPLASAAAAVAPFLVPEQTRPTDIFWTTNPVPCNTPTLPAVALQLYASESVTQALAKIPNLDAGVVQALSAYPGQNPTLGLQRARAYLAEHPVIANQLKAAFHESSQVASAATIDAGAANTLARARALVDLYTGAEARRFNLAGPPWTIPTTRLADVLSAQSDPVRWPLLVEAVSGKVIFVGASERSHEAQKNSSDAFNTVFNDHGLRLQGVELAANAFSNLLHRAELKRRSRYWDFGLCGIISALFAISFALISGGAASLLGLFALSAYIVFALHQFSTVFIWNPLIVPLVLFFVSMLAALSMKYANLVGERIEQVRAWLDVLPLSLVREYLFTGRVHRTATGTCLISDLANYTEMFNSNSDEERARWMEEYLKRTDALLKSHKGYKVDHAGDGTCAIWLDEAADQLRPRRRWWHLWWQLFLASVHDADEAAKQAQQRRRACMCALEMLSLRVTISADHVDPVRLRVGLHCGNLELRDTGDKYDFELKDLGQIPPMTSRLENLNKKLNTQTIATRDFVRTLPEFLWRELGTFQVQGIERPIDAFECLGLKVQASPNDLWRCATFAEALAACRVGKHVEAKMAFTCILDTFGTDGPTHFYLNYLGNGLLAGPFSTAASPLRVAKA